MKLPIPCGTCNQFVEVEITEEGVYHLVCDAGHEVVTFLQGNHFEILFELGGMALLDGYTREAVASMASALERFYEFSINMILANNGIDYEQFVKTWKLVNSQSERQIGAFYFVYLNQFKTYPPSIDDKRITFRNGVIHKGRIPTRSDVFEYAEYLFEYIMTILKVLREHCWGAYGKVITRNQTDYFKKNNSEDGKVYQLYGRSSIFRVDHTDEPFGNFTFKELMSDLQIRMSTHYKK